MAAIRQPLIDLVYNDETGRYIGMLERKLLVYAQNEIRFRALLELLTDEDWDDYQFTEEDGAIRKLAEDALKRRLGLSDEDARSLVQDRWSRHNPDPAPDHTRTYLIGKTPTPHTVHQSRVATGEAKPPYDVDKHLAGLAKARENREADQSRHLQAP
jgi:hypothetical protein